MTLIVLTVVVIALLIAVLAIFLFVIGALLNRTADNLDDCAQNVKNIANHAGVIGPGVVRINETGTTVLGALPLLCDGAESVAVAKGAPYLDPSEDSYSAPYSAPSSTPSAVTTSESSVAVPAASSRSVGYLDEDGARGNLGYLDA
jgi:HAMP domain-containing protein